MGRAEPRAAGLRGASVAVLVVAVAWAWEDRFSRVGVEQQGLVVGMVEIEQSQDAARDRVERLVADPAKTPVVLDETQDGGLVGQGVIHVVAFAER